jgi:hypothetical protein
VTLFPHFLDPPPCDMFYQPLLMKLPIKIVLWHFLLTPSPLKCHVLFEWPLRHHLKCKLWKLFLAQKDITVQLTYALGRPITFGKISWTFSLIVPSVRSPIDWPKVNFYFSVGHLPSRRQQVLKHQLNFLSFVSEPEEGKSKSIFL